MAYGSSAYGAAPYADGAATAAPPTPPTGWPDGVSLRLREGSGIYVETDAPVSLPANRAHRYDAVLVYATPDLVNGRPT